ncbi:MAG: dipeptide ABC transporter ATP-binding protein [Lysobacterales bacterium]|nr:MAG: dipeptide ABC transporter ATP-binding protein [Xanthomonadales bacterium]
MEPLLRVENLRVEARVGADRFAAIVKNVSFSIAPGEVLALIGESGSGKTTIALSALGYARPGCRIAGGHIFLQGTDVLGLERESLRKLRGRRISYLAQSAAATFNPALTIGEQVTESAVLHGVMDRQSAEAHAVELYRRLDLPDVESLGRRYPHQVSGGQLQRLMAAMALCSGPELMVLDEPTTALDVTTQIEVLGAFKEIIRDQGTAAIYVSHDLAVVAQIADRILVLRGGDVMEMGDTAQILSKPAHSYTRKLMAAIRPPPSVGDGEARAEQEAQGEPLVLQVKNLTAGYGPLRNGKPAATVLTEVDAQVKKRSVLGVIGESGCGKSTLARVIAGLLPAASGEVLLDGRDLEDKVADRSLEKLQRVQIVFQMADVALNPRQRIGDILGRPLTLYHGLSGAQREKRVAELLAMVELPVSFSGRYPEELSGGQKQRINLARALAANPDVILADEVTSALDTIVGAAVIDLLKGVRERLGVSYVFISHDLSTVASFADRIMVLYAGRVVEDGTTRQILGLPSHPYTQLLLSSVPELRQGWLEEVMNTRTALAGIARTVEMTDVGCPFFPRCPVAIDGVCDVTKVPYREPAPGHRIACHREIAELAEFEQAL